MDYIKTCGGNFIKLTGSYGRNTSVVYGRTDTATGAPWIAANSANLNPDAAASFLEQD